MINYLSRHIIVEQLSYALFAQEYIIWFCKEINPLNLDQI